MKTEQQINKERAERVAKYNRAVATLEVTPAMKAGRIAHALMGSQDGIFSEVEETVIVALTDLKHLCDIVDLDFEVCSRIAHNHYL